MALAPWKVRVTADGSGTLDAVHATIELVDRAGTPQGPWAWFTPASLVETAGAVTEWSDVSGNNRHLDNVSGSGTLAIEPNAIDGHGALKIDGFLSVNIGKTLDPFRFEDGITEFVVIENDRGFFQTMLVFDGSITGYEINLSSDYQTWDAPAGFATLAGEDPAYTGGNAALMAIAGNGYVGLFRNGAAYNPADPGIYGAPVVVTHGDYSTVPDLSTIFVNPANQWVAEWIVFDRQLSESEQAPWWSYLSGKYPSLF